MDAVARSQLVLALDALRADSTLIIPIRDLKPLLTVEQLTEIRKLEREISLSARELAKQAGEPIVALSCDGQAYWERAKRAIAAGRLFHAMDTAAHEKAAQRLAEQAEEFFWEAVPRDDYPAFLFHEETRMRPNSEGGMTFYAGNHDERWNYTEWKFPLLKQNEVSMPVPRNHALVSVLEAMLETAQVVKPGIEERGKRLRDLARRLRA